MTASGIILSLDINWLRRLVKKNEADKKLLVETEELQESLQSEIDGLGRNPRDAEKAQAKMVKESQLQMCPDTITRLNKQIREQSREIHAIVEEGEPILRKAFATAGERRIQEIAEAVRPFCDNAAAAVRVAKQTCEGQRAAWRASTLGAKLSFANRGAEFVRLVEEAQKEGLLTLKEGAAS